MKRTVSAGEARQRLGEMLEGVFYRGDEVVIERAGKPMAVVIPARLYAQLTASRERLRETLEEAWARNKDIDPAVLEREVSEGIAAVREEMKARHTA